MNQVKALAAALVVLSAPASATDLTNIENVSSLNGADINITDSIDLNQNNLNSPNKVDGIDLDNPGPGIQLNGNKLAANASKFVDRNGDTMTGDLDMTTGTGNIFLDPDRNEIILNNGVDAARTMLRVRESGTEKWKLDYRNEFLAWTETIGGDNNQVIRLKDQGNVEIPNGKLDVSGNLDVSGTLNMNENDINQAGDINMDKRNNQDGPSIKYFMDSSRNDAGNDVELIEIGDNSDDGYLYRATNRGLDYALQIKNTADDRNLLNVRGGGDLEIPNGDLTMAGDSTISGVNRISNGGQGKEDLVIAASSSKNNVIIEGKGRSHIVRTDGATGNVIRFIDGPGDGDGGSTALDINDGATSLAGNNLNNIGTSNVDVVHDSSDDRVEIRSSGQENICIGNCGA